MNNPEPEIVKKELTFSEIDEKEHLEIGDEFNIATLFNVLIKKIDSEKIKDIENIINDDDNDANNYINVINNNMNYLLEAICKRLDMKLNFESFLELNIAQVDYMSYLLEGIRERLDMKLNFDSSDVDNNDLTMKKKILNFKNKLSNLNSTLDALINLISKNDIKKDIFKENKYIDSVSDLSEIGVKFIEFKENELKSIKEHGVNLQNKLEELNEYLISTEKNNNLVTSNSANEIPPINNDKISNVNPNNNNEIPPTNNNKIITSDGGKAKKARKTKKRKGKNQGKTCRKPVKFFVKEKHVCKIHSKKSQKRKV